MASRPGLLAIVRTAVVRAPESARTVLGWVAFGSIAMLLLQAWDVRGRWDPRGIAEFLSVAAGVMGVLLLALVSTIGAGSAAFSAAEDDDLRPVLIALPTVAFAAGALIAASAAFTVTRGVLGLHGMRITFVGALLIMAFALAWRTVSDTTRVLFDRAERRGAQVAEARAALADARMAALQARMQPHFLFNTLNTIAELVRTDPRAAEATVEDLSAILRASLKQGDAPTRPLRDEIALVRALIAVEQRRLGSRLTVTWDVTPDTLDTAVPAMSLQPLVENAIKHGVATRIDGGAVTISADADGDAVRLVVRDDGDGFPARWVEGTGLGNLRERLQPLYGGRATLAVGPGPGGHVTLRIPRAEPS
jgi:sensor histidine kinase YesM